MDRITEINIGEPWCTAMKTGRKTVEGRLNKGKFAKLKRGDVLVVSSSFLVVIKDIRKYDSFVKYLTQEGLRNTLPGVSSIDKGVSVYREFYSEAAEKEHGVLAIRVEVIS